MVAGNPNRPGAYYAATPAARSDISPGNQRSAAFAAFEGRAQGAPITGSACVGVIGTVFGGKLLSVCCREDVGSSENERQRAAAKANL